MNFRYFLVLNDLIWHKVVGTASTTALVVGFGEILQLFLIGCSQVSQPTQMPPMRKF
jgi:hypothetical protein